MPLTMFLRDNGPTFQSTAEASKRAAAQQTHLHTESTMPVCKLGGQAASKDARESSPPSLASAAAAGCSGAMSSSCILSSCLMLCGEESAGA